MRLFVLFSVFLYADSSTCASLKWCNGNGACAKSRTGAAQCICNEGFTGKDCKEKGGRSSGHQSQTRSQQNQGRQSRGHQNGARQNQAHQSQSHQNRGHQSQSHQSQGHQSRGHQSGGHQSRGQQRQNFKQTASSCRELNWCNGNGNCGNLRTGGSKCFCKNGYKGQDCSENSGGSLAQQAQRRSQHFFLTQQHQGHQSQGHKKQAPQNRGHKKQAPQNRGHQNQAPKNQGQQSEDCYCD
ncbi:unnamed protein product [Oikopleura dioica]|uniref:EGF-like domain-containing protein n=1 Tax=Oikopleura dioica TaxID=34765 RepID=E4YXR5_OIKDI|nr:unnamed protein product [Oikopleura dioica]